MALKTEFAFTLPKGYVDRGGRVHRSGTMRLANAADEIEPIRDPRVRDNEAYLPMIVLSRVISRLGDLTDIHPGIIEALFVGDVAYLEEFYETINFSESDSAEGEQEIDSRLVSIGAGLPSGEYASNTVSP
jgi:hypothetical protein